MSIKNLAIIIPARYASKRFPGKPLALLNGKAMLLHVWEQAQKVKKTVPNCFIAVATDDERIVSFCKKNNIEVIMTSTSCRNGTERVQEVFYKKQQEFDFIINLQGDNPLCPPSFLEKLCYTYLENPTKECIITPITNLSWSSLAELEENKKITPFSGTTVVFDKQGYALYFSKQIIPAIRNKTTWQSKTKLSPVYRHIGVYGYTKEILTNLTSIPESHYELYEGLEQLRFLENNIPIKCISVSYPIVELSALSGIDTQEDLKKAEILLQQFVQSQ